MKSPLQRLLCLIASTALAAGLCGCANYRSETAGLRAAWAAGDLERTGQVASREANDDTESADYVIWRLEEASAWRALDRFTASDEAFDHAATRIAEFDAGAEVRLLQEAKANFTNQSYLPYTGYDYDRIMLNTYRALNYLQLGDAAAARVMLNRAYQSQREAVQANAKAIEAANQLANEESRAAKRASPGKNYNVNRARQDPRFDRQIQAQYGYLTGLRAYADYVNPFTVFLDGLVHATNALEASDLERARNSFARAAKMVPDNAYLANDIADTEARQRGDRLSPVTHVVFETGMAPSRDQIRIDIPVFLFTSEVPYVGAAFPQLKFNPDYAPSLIAIAEGREHRTALLCDMDAVVATEFDNRLAEVVVKTLISAGTKAAAQYGLQQAAKKDSGAYYAIAVIGSLYQAAMNQADLRTWVTLPKQFQYCRFPTPGNGQLTLRAGTQSQTIGLRPGATNLVYIKSNSQACPLLIQVNILEPLEPVPPRPDPTSAELARL